MIEKTGYRAKAKWLMGSAFKVRPVADLIRLKPYADAIAILDNMPQKGAQLIKKVVVSAASNALNKNRNWRGYALHQGIRIDEAPGCGRVGSRSSRLTAHQENVPYFCVVDEIGKSRGVIGQ